MTVTRQLLEGVLTEAQNPFKEIFKNLRIGYDDVINTINFYEDARILEFKNERDNLYIKFDIKSGNIDFKHKFEDCLDNTIKDYKSHIKSNKNKFAEDQCEAIAQGLESLVGDAIKDYVRFVDSVNTICYELAVNAKTIAQMEATEIDTLLKNAAVKYIKK